MTLSKLTSSDLIISAESAIKLERKATVAVLEHLREIEKRKLYFKYGYSSLFAMVTKKFGYSEASAQRRINSMRLIRDMPEAADKIASGELSLSVAASVQTFFREKKGMPLAEKRDVISVCANQSARKVEKELAARHPEKEKRESTRYTKSDRLRMSVNISEDLFAKLETSKYKNGFTCLEDLLHYYVDRDLAESPCIQKATSTPTSEVKTRYISKITQKIVIKRNSEKKCEYVDPVTKIRCSETTGLQYDHQIPHSKGGPNIADNLRQLCGPHNRYAWHHGQK